MDLSKVEQNEEKRQEFIKLQEGDGSYNPITGTYKWGSNVYDLTKTNGEPGLGWLPIRNKPLKYKTIHQNKNELEQFYKPSSNTNDVIANLDRYEGTFNGMEKVLDGEYVLFSDVIEAVSILFSAKKD